MEVGDFDRRLLQHALSWVAATLLLFAGTVQLRGQQVVDTATGTASVQILAPGDHARLGAALAAGDLNGDGNLDLVVGAPSRQSTSGSRPGAVFVFFGPLSAGVIDLADSSADVTVVEVDTLGSLGSSVAAADVNGDGVDDLVIGAPAKAGQSRLESGVVYVYFGRSSWPQLLDPETSTADVEIWGSDFFEHLGTAVALGDVDTLPPKDLVLSAPDASGPAGSASGRVYLLLGGTHLQGTIDLKVTPANLTVTGRESQGFFGWALACGDLNGDGLEDIAIGSYKVDVRFQIDTGEAYVLFGSPVLPDTVDLSVVAPGVRLIGADKRDHFGFSLASGDLNGDGIADLVAGARQADWPGGPSEPGAVFGFLGRPSFPDSVDLSQERADFVGLGAVPSGQFGYSVALGDVNEDGRPDLLVGAPAADAAGRTGAGEAFLLSGVAAGEWDLSVRPASVTYLGPGEGAGLGKAVLIADLNAEQTGDLVMAAPDAGGGRVLIFFGDRTVAVEEDSRESASTTFGLLPAYPNPFNGRTLLRFHVGEATERPILEVYDRLGHRVRRLAVRSVGDGRYEATWDGTDRTKRPVASGVYVARLRVGPQVASTKLILIR